MKNNLINFRNAVLCVTSFTLFSSLSTLANAQDGEGLIQEKRCYACHEMNDTLLAPPYQAIAQRHSSRKEIMVDVLARKIVDGGGGNWGLVPMVPNQRVSIDEARTMAAWILALADK